MEQCGVNIKLYVRYMDDGRTVLHPFKHGWRWEGDGIKFRGKWEQEDQDLTPTEITKNILLGSMMGVEDFLKFTVETDEDPGFGGWLPTLDTSLKVTAENVIQYKFYEKPTTTQKVIMKQSAMAENSKIQVLSNELIRRLKNTSLELGEEVKVEILDGYTQKLINSGYTLE